MSEYQVSEKELSLYQSSSTLGQSTLKGKHKECKVIPDIIADAVPYGKKRRKRIKNLQKVQQPSHGKKSKEDNILDSADKIKESTSEDSTSSDEDDTIGSMHSTFLETEEELNKGSKENFCICKFMWIL